MSLRSRRQVAATVFARHLHMLTLRRYRPADADAVWDLHNRALNAVGAHAGNGEWDDDLHHIEAVYLRDGGEFLVGEVAGEIVAMGALRRRSETRAEITRMRISPEWQRHGFGRAVLRALEARAQELGYGVLELETTTVQTPAQRLYETSGYRRTGRKTVAGFDVLVYEKEVPGEG